MQSPGTETATVPSDQTLRPHRRSMCRPKSGRSMPSMTQAVPSPPPYSLSTATERFPASAVPPSVRSEPVLQWDRIPEAPSEPVRACHTPPDHSQTATRRIPVVIPAISPVPTPATVAARPSVRLWISSSRLHEFRRSAASPCCEQETRTQRIHRGPRAVPPAVPGSC